MAHRNPVEGNFHHAVQAHPFKHIAPRPVGDWLASNARWENFLLFFFILLIPLCFFYNLDVNPRPWHDEGSYLTLARTLVEDGVYAVRNSDGYQTFGAVQSVGPSVVLPVALSFKLLGVGLFQARLVAAIFSLLTLLCFFLAAQDLFDRPTALVAVLLVLCSPAVGFLLWGRQVLGEVPAFGFFLAGWLFLSKGTQSRKFILYLLSGLCFGLAIVTKNQYLITLLPTFVFLAILDVVYYRTRNYWHLMMLLAIAGLCYALWWVWQYTYFGPQVFNENAEKLSQLGVATTYVSFDKLVSSVRYLAGTGSGHLYLFWGIPAVVFACILSLRKNREGLVSAFLLIFPILWLAYEFVFSAPWSLYYLPPMSLLAIFVAGIVVILAREIARIGKDLFHETRQAGKEKTSISTRLILALGTLIALLSFGLWAGYELQTRIREQVLEKVGFFEPEIAAPLSFPEPHQIADYLKKNIPSEKVVETWERELGILTSQNFHYPDQSLLTDSYTTRVREGRPFYELGDEYFAQVKPDYLIIGWYGRHYELYDPQFLASHARLMTTIGQSDWRYEVYELNP
jgi:4-amino-4-deoxy-L-arabinose transferase-like glycosyltransferase